MEKLVKKEAGGQRPEASGTETGVSENRTKQMKIDSWRDLEAYKNAFVLQQLIFDSSKAWPKSESYSLIDQIRRSSRAIGANITESWAKRRYPAHFISKLTDADGELQETLHWLASAEACDYIDSETAADFKSKASIIGRQIGGMINKHESFCS